jgi:hypothetical protein
MYRVYSCWHGTQTRPSVHYGPKSDYDTVKCVAEVPTFIFLRTNLVQDPITLITAAEFFSVFSQTAVAAEI